MPQKAAPPPLDEPDLLQVCPWCEYSLHRLPIVHTCPECGHELNRRCRVFHSVSRGSRLVLRIFFPIALLYLGMNIFIAIRDPEWQHLIFIGLISGWLVLMLYRYLAAAATFICVTPDAVSVLNRRTGESARYPLDRIQRARVNSSAGLVLHLVDTRITIKALGGSSADVYRCASFINHLIGADASGESSRAGP